MSDDRCRHFFDAIVPGDVVLCRVVQKSMSGLMLSVLCLDPVTNKSRYIEDLKIRCFCPSGRVISSAFSLPLVLVNFPHDGVCR